MKKIFGSHDLELQLDVIRGPKFYMMFANTPRGQRFADLWDEGMARLYATGELNELYARFEDPTYQDLRQANPSTGN